MPPELPSDPDALAKLLGAAGLHYDPAADTGPPIGPPAPPVAPPKFALPADVAARTATQNAQADTIGPTTVQPPVAPPPGPQVFATQPAAAGVPGAAHGGGNPYAAYLKSLQGQQGAADDVARAQGQLVENEGIAQGLKGQALAGDQADALSKAQARDAEAQRAIAEVDAASKDAASAKIDPDEWWHSQSLADKGRLTLASALSEFGTGLVGGRNSVLDQINKHVDDSIAAQRQAIESKHGRVADMKGSLAEMYRRFGNMDQAEAGARILHLQQLDAEAMQYGATAKSDLVAKNAELAHRQFQSEIEKQKAQLTARAHVTTPKEQAELDKLRAETGKTLAETDKLKSGAAAEAPQDAPNFTFGEAVKSYLFPGSDAGLKRAQLEQHNTGVVGAVHKSTGLRGESLDKAGESYASSPFTPNALINQRNEAARRFSKGAAPGEPLPAEFEEDEK